MLLCDRYSTGKLCGSFALFRLHGLIGGVGLKQAVKSLSAARAALPGRCCFHRLRAQKQSVRSMPGDQSRGWDGMSMCTYSDHPLREGSRRSLRAGGGGLHDHADAAGGDAAAAAAAAAAVCAALGGGGAARVAAPPAAGLAAAGLAAAGLAAGGAAPPHVAAAAAAAAAAHTVAVPGDAAAVHDFAAAGAPAPARCVRAAVARWAPQQPSHSPAQDAAPGHHLQVRSAEAALESGLRNLRTRNPSALCRAA